MKKITFWKSLFLLCALIVGSTSAWATDVVVTLNNIGAGIGDAANTTAATTDITATGTTDSYTLNYYQCKKQGNSMLMTKSVSPYISNKTAMPGNIKSVEVFTNSGSSGKTTYDCAFSTTECTSAVSGIGAYKIGEGNSHTYSNLKNDETINVKGKYFCITLGNANNGQVLKLVITCESNDPIINADNPANLNYDATSGTIGYTVGNYTGGTVTASTEADWISNFNYDEANQIGFSTTINEGKKRSATITLTLKSATNETVTTKNVTVTQNAIPPMVTIQTPTGGTLVVKNGTATVTSGDRLPVGTELTIEVTADATYKYRNWQYKKGENNWATKTTNFTYTLDDDDVQIRANFDRTYVVNWSVNGTVTSSATRYAEGEKITFPESVTPFENFTFVGWAEAAIDGSVTNAPTLVDTSNETMGNADKTYYAVYGENNKSIATATFDASDITNLTAATTTKTWTDNATGIQMYISNGDRYTGTPNAWNVTKSTSNNDYYMSIGRAKCAIKKVVITVTGSDYAFGDYYAYTYTSDETGTDLTSDVTSSNNVYTWQLQNDYEQVILWSGYSYQVRATKIVVDAEMDVVKGYMTTIPTTGTITLNAACTDSNVIYGTYYTNRAYEMPENVVGQVVSVDNDGKLVVEDAYNPGDVVPAYTALLLYTIDDFTGTKDYTITYSTGGTDLSDYNMLKGTLTADDETTGDNCLFYRLTMHKGTTIGFYWGAENGAAFKPGANKAYLAVPTAQAAKMSGFAFDSTTTGINGVEEIAPVTKTRKVVKNGRLVIETANGEFTIDGARMK